MPTESNGLFRHSKRPQWGLALLAWERSDRRAYQFDDGKIRIIKEGFYYLMEPAEIDEGAELRVTSALEETFKARQSGKKKPLEPVYPFSEQIRIFTTLYPEGFQDEKWKKKFRGEGCKRLKRHRAPAIADAKEQLAKEALEALIAEDRAEEIVDRATEVLRPTDLIRVGRIEELDELEGEVRKEVGVALYELLWGEEGFGTRFRDWTKSLGGGLETKLSWRMVTSLTSLVHPDEHPYIRHSAFKKQAAVFAPNRLYTPRPRRTSYGNFRWVAIATRDGLEREGFKPVDLLDVHDFIWTTLRPSAAKLLET